MDANKVALKLVNNNNKLKLGSWIQLHESYKLNHGKNDRVHHV